MGGLIGHTGQNETVSDLSVTVSPNLPGVSTADNHFQILNEIAIQIELGYLVVP